RMGKPLRIDVKTASRLGSSYELLVPFLERGSTVAVVPVATPAEVLATLMILSLDPARPLDDATVETALAIAGQAALAIDNARLYQQQKDFADTMQRSLLPRVAPDLEGLELGAVYESSARVDVGGDVYDYLRLPDGRLAVVLGDVTGHGIEATADMAMAKFVFRSLAREHPEPGESVVLFTDGVVEARRDRELYGLERLDETLVRGAALDAEELAATVVEDCRSFVGGGLGDDCAVVVIRRTG